MDNELSRRRMVAIGAALGGAGLVAGATNAQALTEQLAPMSNPGGARIGSAGIGGYSYLHRNFYDFSAKDNGPRVFGAGAVYANGGGEMVATADVPAGAILRDVEWYVYTPGGSGVWLAAFLWTTGMTANLILGQAPPLNPNSGLQAQRLVIPAATNGPYPLGARLILYAVTSSGRQINGARIGYSMAPAGAVMLPAPVRVYDSRSGSKIGNGQTRILSLASRIPAGATAAILNVSVTSGERSGGLAVYNTGSSLPSGSALYFNGGTTATNEIHTKLPSDRKVKVTMRGVSGSKAHYFIDLVGYTA